MSTLQDVYDAFAEARRQHDGAEAARVRGLALAQRALEEGHSKSKVAAAACLNDSALTKAMRAAGQDPTSHYAQPRRGGSQAVRDHKLSVAGRNGGKKSQDAEALRRREKANTAELIEKARAERGHFDPDDPASDF